MRVLLSPEAQREIEEARRYYDRQKQGLGAEFNRAVGTGLARVRNWPLSCPVEVEDVRRLVLSRFPYKLFYSVEPDLLYVIAVAHQHREPAYWQGRVTRPQQ